MMKEKEVKIVLFVFLGGPAVLAVLITMYYGIDILTLLAGSLTGVIFGLLVNTRIKTTYYAIIVSVVISGLMFFLIQLIFMNATADVLNWMILCVLYTAPACILTSVVYKAFLKKYNR